MLIIVCVCLGVRSAAADCMPRLLECGVFKGQQFVNQMWMAMFPALIEAIQTEHDLDVLADLMQSLAGVPYLSP